MLESYLSMKQLKYLHAYGSYALPLSPNRIQRKYWPYSWIEWCAREVVAATSSNLDHLESTEHHFSPHYILKVSIKILHESGGHTETQTMRFSYLDHLRVQQHSYYGGHERPGQPQRIRHESSQEL